MKGFIIGFIVGSLIGGMYVTYRITGQVTKNIDCRNCVEALQGKDKEWKDL